MVLPLSEIQLFCMFNLFFLFSITNGVLINKYFPKFLFIYIGYLYCCVVNRGLKYYYGILYISLSWFYNEYFALDIN